MDSLREVHQLGFLFEVINLGQLYFLYMIQYLGCVMIIKPSAISLESVPIIG